MLIQLLLPTTFFPGTASQEATAVLVETRRELADGQRHGTPCAVSPNAATARRRENKC
jgi:hypothetical protein